MNDFQKKKYSKFLSYVLRHHPGAIGMDLDASGYVRVEILLNALQKAGKPLTREELEEIVATNDKKRFAFSSDGSMIRASQGHSIDIELGLTPVIPPRILYHGTVAKSLEAIDQEGLVKGSRQYVHLSGDIETAKKVGKRRGKPVVLVIESGRMHREGHTFYLSENKVWLTDSVPDEYIRFPCPWKINPIANKILLWPWEHVTSEEQSSRLVNELKAECQPAHRLSSFEGLAVARKISSDDVLFREKNGNHLFLVHLTYGSYPDKNSDYPMFRSYENVDEFIQNEMLPDHDSY